MVLGEERQPLLIPTPTPTTTSDAAGGDGGHRRCSRIDACDDDDVERATTTRTTTTTQHQNQNQRRRSRVLAVVVGVVGVVGCVATAATTVMRDGSWSWGSSSLWGDGGGPGGIVERIVASVGASNALEREWTQGLNRADWKPDGEGFRLGKGNGGNPRVREAYVFLKANIERYYPSRIAPGSEPFSVYFSVDDMPRTHCLSKKWGHSHCHFDGWPFVFNFGSSPKDPTLIPKIIRATPVTMTGCVMDVIAGNETALSEDTSVTCSWLTYHSTKSLDEFCDKNDKGHQSFDCKYIGLFNKGSMPNPKAYEWNALISKAFWRGSDYPFLQPTLVGGAAKPRSSAFYSQLSSPDKAGAARRLLAGNKIGPRLRAVLMSLLHPELIDAKFFNWNPKTRAVRSLREMGLVTDDHVGLETFGRYRYQLDLGGGGGTTWSGVIPKLSLPGVLLHHETMMIDSYFPLLKPWEHYLPLESDLSNLQELIQWVEHHPKQARIISDKASTWVRGFTKMGQQLRFNYKNVVTPLAQVLDPTGQLKPVPFTTAHPTLHDVTW